MGEILDRTRLIIRTKLSSRRERSAFKPNRDHLDQTRKTVADLNRVGALNDHQAAGLNDVIDDMTVKAPNVDVDGLTEIGSERIKFAKKVIASTDRPGLIDVDGLAALEFVADVSRKAETQVKPEARVHTDTPGGLVSRRTVLLGLGGTAALGLLYLMKNNTPRIDYGKTWNLEIGGKTPKELEEALDNAKVDVHESARSMIKSPQFTTLAKTETRRLVMLSVRDMGFQGVATATQIIGAETDTDWLVIPAPFTKGRMTKLGLDFCPPEVGVLQRLADVNQEMNTWYLVVTKLTTASGVRPYVFNLTRGNDGLWLAGGVSGGPGFWQPEARLVFSFRR